MAKIIAIANRKGGCSKTTTTKALAEILNSEHNQKVLCIDVDPQGNLSRWSGVDTENKNTAYELLTGKAKIKDTIIKCKYYDLVPADEMLTQAEIELNNKCGHEFALKNVLDSIQDEYDYILIDTPPNLGILTIIAFVACNSGIVITTDTGMFATAGIAKLTETLNAVQKFYNQNAKVLGILLTKYNSRYKNDKKIKELTELLSEQLSASVFKTKIRTSVALPESVTYSIDIMDLKPAPNPVYDYIAFTEELLAI